MAVLSYLIFLIFSFGQLQRLSFFNQRINFYLYEIFLVIFFLILFFKLRLTPLKKLWQDNKFIFSFFLILFFSFVNNFLPYKFFDNLVAFLYLLRLLFYPLFFFYLNFYLKKDFYLKNKMINGFFLFSFLTIVFSITQYFLYPDLRNLFYQGWDPHLYRVFGVFFDTFLSGAIFGSLFLFWNNWIFKIIFLILIVLSFSRSAYLSLLLIFLLKGIFDKRFLKGGLFFLLFFLLILFISPKPFGEGVNLKRTISVKARIDDYQKAWQFFLKKPVLGYGYNRIFLLKDNLEGDHGKANFSSVYLNILVSTGIFGIVSFFTSLFFIFKNLKEKGRMILIFLILMSFFDNVLFHPMIMFLFGFISLFDR